MKHLPARKPAVLLSLALWVTLSGRLLVAAPDDVDAAPAVEAAVEERVFIDEANFDQWIFQGRGDANTARQRIQSALKLQIDEVHRVCELTEEQKDKLTLAGKGDAKRFFEEVEVVREKFRAVQNDANAFNGIWQDIQPLQQKLARGLFGEKSFFAKTLRKTLTPEQVARFQTNLDERRKYRYRVMVEVGITSLENSVPLRHEQQKALVKLLLEKSEPPQSFGQYDQYVVMHQLSTLPEQDLKAVLNERQWELFERQLGQFRGMLPVLRQNGILAE
jgi:hypothetical protein